jgi:hypothetical protein
MKDALETERLPDQDRRGMDGESSAQIDEPSRIVILKWSWPKTTTLSPALKWTGETAS